MTFFHRIYNLWRALLGSGVAELETRHAAELLELERAELCRRVANYNHGLAGYAGSCERMRSQLATLELEQRQLRTRVDARLSVADRAGAGRCALRLEEVAQELAGLRAQLAQTESTYSELLRARELMVGAARDKLGALKRGIRELETQQALVGLSELSAGMQNSFDGSGATLERLLERVEERRTLAAGRARVAREALPLGDARALEAERAILAEQALRRLEADSGEQPRLTLPRGSAS
jgi:phage shock protein A